MQEILDVRGLKKTFSLSAKQRRIERTDSRVKVALDGLSFKAAKYAVSNSVPIVGGFLGSGFDLLAAGSVLIKNSLGSCGLVLLAAVIGVPLVQLIAYNLFLKLSAAVVEPVGDAAIADFLSSLSGTVNYFTAGLLAIGFMYFVTVLLLICSSNALF